MNLTIILPLHFCLKIYVYISVFGTERHSNGVEDHSPKFMHSTRSSGNVGSKVFFLIISE